MAEDERKILPSDVLRYARNDDEYQQYLLQLAGKDPKRHAAILRWNRLNAIFDRETDHLDILHFENVQLERKDIEPIALFPELEELKFRNSPLNSEFFPLIVGLPNLHSFSYTGQLDMGNTICEVASSYPNLQVLCLEGQGIDNVGIREVGKLKKLKVLYLSKTKISLDGVRSLEEIENLTRIDFVDCKYIDDECLQVLGRIKSLEVLSFSGGGVKITDEGISHLRPLENLREVFLANTAVTDAAIKTLADFANLHGLILESTPITNEAIGILQNEPRLYRLRIPHTNVDDGAVAYLETMTQLSDLDLRGTKISAEGVRKIQAKLKSRVKNDFGKFPTKRELERESSSRK